MEIKKNSNLELLRIISIWLIVAHHMVLHTGILNEVVSFNRIIAQIYNIGAYIGVNAFFMITGWFCIEKQFRIERVLKVYRQAWIYSVVILIFFIIICPEMVSIKTVIKSILPVTFNSWWFVTAYIGMMLLSPFMNILIHAMSKKQFCLLIGVSIIMLLGLHTFTTQRPYFSNLAIACFYYLLSAGLKNFAIYECEKITKWIKKRYFAIIVGLIICSTVVFSIGESFIPQLHEGVNFFTGIDTITIFIATVVFFGIFVLKKPVYNRTINFLGARTFAIYLLQSNILIVNVLWPFIKKSGINESMFYILFAPLIISGICLVGVAIEQIRIVISKPILRIIGINRFDDVKRKIDKNFIE